MDEGSKQGQMKKINSQFYANTDIEIGSGNYGVVYKGYNIFHNQIVAVKFMDSKRLQKFQNYERQIAVMLDLAKYTHPNIMGFYGFEKKQQGLYIFLELCTGGNLQEVGHNLSQIRVLLLLHQLLEAMTYINEQKILHRDLKPGNILFDENGQLKIADFGLAREIDLNMTPYMCTPLYAAPEVLIDTYDQRCDVWSAGLILYFMLTGKQLFENIKKKNMLIKEHEKFQNKNHKVKIPEQLHPLWSQIIQRMLVYNREQRPTFKQLLSFFNTIKTKMKIDLKQKYGEQQFDDYDLRLSKAINPYQNFSKLCKIPTSSQLQVKIKQENSFICLNSLRKWLAFVRQRADFLVILIKQFNNCDYSCLLNAQKYVLMFLAIGAYLSRMKSLLQQVQNRSVNVEGQIIKDEKISEGHKEQYLEILKESEAKFINYIGKYEKAFKEQLHFRIMETYMKRAQQSEMLKKQQDLFNLLTETQGKNYCWEQKVYFNLYRKITNSKPYFMEVNRLKQTSFPLQYVKVYTQIRVIHNLNSFFEDKHYKDQDYVRSLKQKIEISGKTDLLALISRLN